MQPLKVYLLSLWVAVLAGAFVSKLSWLLGLPGEVFWPIWAGLAIVTGGLLLLSRIRAQLPIQMSEAWRFPLSAAGILGMALLLAGLFGNIHADHLSQTFLTLGTLVNTAALAALGLTKSP